MKKPKKLKKPKVPERLKSIPNPLKRKSKSAEDKVNDALSNVPRITNETVADHREEVLSGARKHIYPLQHSKHHVVRITVGIIITVLVIFFVLTGLSLYKFQSTSAFMYDVTRIIPFPVAKAGNNWVSYESYLFELRHNMHYYKTQQQTNFATKDGQTQLSRLKKQALDQVIQDAYVKQLAADNKVTVSNRAVDDEIALLRQQNRLGNSDRVFKEVLKEFWGWNVSDFKKELKQQMLQQAVLVKLDNATNTKAQTALKKLISGEDFAKVATEMSDDTLTKPAGGQYPAVITLGARDLHPHITNELFKLKAGQTSSLINAGNRIEIVKVTENNGATVKAAHIQFNHKEINAFIKPKQSKQPTAIYIKVN